MLKVTKGKFIFFVFFYLHRIPPVAPVKQSLNQLKSAVVEQDLTASVTPTQPAAAPVVVQPLTNIHVPVTSVKPGELSFIHLADLIIRFIDLYLMH